MERIAPEYEKAIKERISFQIETGKPAPPMEQEYLRHDGLRIPVETSAVAIKFEGKDAHLVFVRDIAERKLAEAALKNSEERYRSLFERLTAGAVLAEPIFDGDGRLVDLRYLMANHSVNKHIGKSPEELVGKLYSEVFHHTGRNPVFDVYEKVLSSGEPYQGELFLPGLNRDCDIAAYCPSPGQLALIVSDIAERKQSEMEIKNKNEEINAAYQQLAASGKELEEKYRELERSKTALLESEERYRMIFNQSPLGIMHFDAKGTILDFNENFRRIMGATREGILGFNMLGKLRDPEMLKAVKDALRGRMGYYEGDYVSVTGGKTTPMRAIYQTIVDSSGGFIGAIGLFEDISEYKRAEAKRRELEDRIQRSEKMEALGLLAGGVAHDLNNTLGGLIGYAELLYDAMDESDPLREDARNIITGGEQSAAIVQDLLTLARRGVQTKTIIHLNRIIAEYFKSPEYLKLESCNPHVRIKAELDEELLQISGSRVHLTKTLMNLVSNAAEAMTSGGEITVRTENRYLDRPVPGFDELQEGDYVVLSVKDEGEGISHEDMKRIFEPFYTKKVMGRSGTGLGLSVVWGTVKDHNGYIDVQSRKGRGTIFCLYFPVTQDKEDEKEATALIDQYMGNGEKILVVDDIRTQRDLAYRILSKLNYNVTTVLSGEEAVKYLKANDADLVVLDMIMDPGIDGFETYRQISEFKPKQKAIIVSGFAETELVKMTQSLGAGAFVKKPYIKERIGLAVRRELDRK